MTISPSSRSSRDASWSSWRSLLSCASPCEPPMFPPVFWYSVSSSTVIVFSSPVRVMPGFMPPCGSLPSGISPSGIVSSDSSSCPVPPSASGLAGGTFSSWGASPSSGFLGSSPRAIVISFPSILDTSPYRVSSFSFDVSDWHPVTVAVTVITSIVVPVRIIAILLFIHSILSLRHIIFARHSVYVINIKDGFG